MKKQCFLLFSILILVTFTSTACGGGGGGGSGSAQGTPLPTLPPVPSQYQGVKPPFDLTSASVIAQGKTIYDSHCATCHGDKGLGDGPAAAGLQPPPINFTGPYFKSMSPDFRFWRVSEGVPGTGMVAWKGSLTSDQIWQVIAYVTSLAK
jgi:mono/diheme cytochrome c family protein